MIRITVESQTRLPLVGLVSPRQAKAALLATGLALAVIVPVVALLFLRAARARKMLLAETESKRPVG